MKSKIEISYQSLMNSKIEISFRRTMGNVGRKLHTNIFNDRTIGYRGMMHLRDAWSAKNYVIFKSKTPWKLENRKSKKKNPRECCNEALHKIWHQWSQLLARYDVLDGDDPPNSMLFFGINRKKTLQIGKSKIRENAP